MVVTVQKPVVSGVTGDVSANSVMWPFQFTLCCCVLVDLIG